MENTVVDGFVFMLRPGRQMRQTKRGRKRNSTAKNLQLRSII